MPRTALELLRLLAADAPAEQIEEKARALAAADPDDGEAARELALRVRAGLDAHRRREAGAVRAGRHRARPRLAARPRRRPRRDRAPGPDVAACGRRLPDPVRSRPRRHLHAGDRRFGVGAVPGPAAAGRGRAGRPRRPDPPPLLERRLPGGRAVPAHERDRRGGRRRGAHRDLRHPAARRRRVRRGAVRLEPDPAGLPPRRGGAARLAGRARRRLAGPVPAGRRDGRHPRRPVRGARGHRAGRRGARPVRRGGPRGRRGRRHHRGARRGAGVLGGGARRRREPARGARAGPGRAPGAGPATATRTAARTGRPIRSPTRPPCGAPPERAGSPRRTACGRLP